MRKLFSLLAAVLFAGSMMAATTYYTPTQATEYFYLVESSTTLKAHNAIQNATGTFTINTSDRTCANPADLSKTEKKNLTLDLKDATNSAKTAVINVAGCSEITICHTSNSGRKIKAVLTPSVGTASTQYGNVSSTKSTFTLEPTKSYSILFTAVDGNNAGADLYASAIVLTKGATMPEHNITYAETKGADMDAYPKKYTEGTGIASFADLADVAGFKFAGWSPASISAEANTDMTITATWTPVVTKNITYAETKGAENTNPEVYVVGEGIAEFAPLADVEGFKFAGWNPASISAEATEDVTVTATWNKVGYYPIYSFEDEIGAASVSASDATVDENGLKLSNTSGRIQLTPREGYQFQNGDKIEFAGTIGNASKKFGVIIYEGTTKKNTIEAAAGQPCECAGKLTLSGNQNNILIARADGSTTTLTSCVISREMVVVSEVYAGKVIVDGEEKSIAAVENVITLENAFAEAPAVALVNKISYEGSLTAYEKIAVTLNLDGEFFVGTATIGETTYTVKAAKATGYEVRYFDGETEYEDLKETVVAGGKATQPENDPKKAGYAFKFWHLDGVDAAFDFDNTEITENTSLYAGWEDAFAKTVDFEAAATSGEKNVATVLGDNNYYYTGGATTWDNNTTTNNGAYLGLKMKEANSTVEFRVEANHTVILKVGILVNSKSEFYKNGVKVAENMVGGSKTSGELNYKNYTFYSDAEATYKFKTTSADAQIIKAITIVEGYARIIEGYNFGTICLNKGGVLSDNATLYKVAYKYYNAAEVLAGISLVEVENNQLVAGGAYIFETKSQNETIVVNVDTEDEPAPAEAGALVGTYTNKTYVPVGGYIIQGSEILQVQTAEAAWVNANRAYIDMTQVPDKEEYQGEAPTRFFGISGVTFNPIVTGVEELNAVKATKALVNGKLVIKKGAHTFNANGAMLK